AAYETALSPLAGRMIDRRGVLIPVQLALAVSVVVSVGLAVDPRPLVYVPLLIAASGAYGVLFTPAFALIADGAERSGLPPGMSSSSGRTTSPIICSIRSVGSATAIAQK